MREASRVEVTAARDRSLDVVGLFVYRGHHRYGETVTQLQHVLETAHLARRDGGDDDVVLAALLHDLGHLLEEAADTPDRHHGHRAAEVLRPLVPPRMAWLVEHHVIAKRYLCAVDPGYAARLSPASVRSLAAQGAPLSPEAQRSFETQPWFADAVRGPSVGRRGEGSGRGGGPARQVPGADRALVRPPALGDRTGNRLTRRHAAQAVVDAQRPCVPYTRRHRVPPEEKPLLKTLAAPARGAVSPGPSLSFRRTPRRSRGGGPAALVPFEPWGSRKLMDANDVNPNGSLDFTAPFDRPYDWTASGDPALLARTFAFFATDAGLQEVKTYADGIGPWKRHIVSSAAVDLNGDDRRGGHTWKFVSLDLVRQPADPANSALFEQGTLYVARYSPGAQHTDESIPPTVLSAAELAARGAATRDGLIKLPRRNGVAGETIDGGSVNVTRTNEASKLPSQQPGALYKLIEDSEDGTGLTFRWERFVQGGGEDVPIGDGTVLSRSLEILRLDGTLISQTRNVPRGSAWPDNFERPALPLSQQYPRPSVIGIRRKQDR